MCQTGLRVGASTAWEWLVLTCHSADLQVTGTLFEVSLRKIEHDA